MKRIYSLLITTFILVGLTSNAQNESFFFVFLNTNPDKEELPDEKVEDLQTAHLKNIERLYLDGKLPVAGPFEGGGGMFIFKTGSIEETQELLQSDPAIMAKRFKLEIFPFYQYHGSICSLGEEYEMKYRMFIRFTTDEDPASTSDQANKILAEEFAAFESADSKKIMAANFGGTNGGIWLMEGESEPVVEFLENSKKIKQSGISYELKTLWVAGGIFCEK